MKKKIPILIGLDSQYRLVKDENLKRDDLWFFIGDIHGDSECLKWIFQHIESFKSFRLCLLGDVFDRGLDEVNSFKMILNFSNKHPNKVMWLAGNHDCTITKNSNLKDWPSYLIDIRNELMPRLPVLALFNKGMIAMHGGPPSASMLNLNKVNIFTLPGIFDKLQMSRFIELKNPEEDMEHEKSFGINDLLKFSKHLKISEPIKMLIRGHDHPLKGYHLYSHTSGVKVVTLLASSKIGFQFMPKLQRKYTTIGKLYHDGSFKIEKINFS